MQKADALPRSKGDLFLMSEIPAPSEQSPAAVTAARQFSACVFFSTKHLGRILLYEGPPRLPILLRLN